MRKSFFPYLLFLFVIFNIFRQIIYISAKEFDGEIEFQSLSDDINQNKSLIEELQKIDIYSKLQNLEVFSNNLSIISEKKQMIFEKNILIYLSDIRIYADKMIVYYHQDDKEINKENSVVRIVNKDFLESIYKIVIPGKMVILKKNLNQMNDSNILMIYSSGCVFEKSNKDDIDSNILTLKDNLIVKDNDYYSVKSIKINYNNSK